MSVDIEDRIIKMKKFKECVRRHYREIFQMRSESRKLDKTRKEKQWQCPGAIMSDCFLKEPRNGG